jgi:hypothetical protein
VCYHAQPGLLNFSTLDLSTCASPSPL